MFQILMIIWAFLLVTIGISSEEPYHRTAFIGKPGDVDTFVSYSNYTTKNFWNKNGKKLPTFNRFENHSFNFYCEYAFHKCNSITLNEGYLRVIESLNGNSQGFEDAQIGWKHLFYEGIQSAFTSQVIAIIPPGNRKSSIRYGRVGGELSLLYSKMFDLRGHCSWVDVGLGYRIYQGFPSDQIRLDLSVGYHLRRHIRLIASSLMVYGVYNGKTNHRSNNIVYNPKYRLLKLHFECSFKVCSPLSISVGIFKNVWGRNVGAGGGFFGGVWIDF